MKNIFIVSLVFLLSSCASTLTRESVPNGPLHLPHANVEFEYVTTHVIDQEMIYEVTRSSEYLLYSSREYILYDEVWELAKAEFGQDVYIDQIREEYITTKGLFGPTKRIQRVIVDIHKRVD